MRIDITAVSKCGLGILIIAILLASGGCQDDEPADLVGHTKKLTEVVTDSIHFKISYHENGKVSKVEWLTESEVGVTMGNQYNSDGRVTEMRYSERDFDDWIERFEYSEKDLEVAEIGFLDIMSWEPFYEYTLESEPEDEVRKYRLELTSGSWRAYRLWHDKEGSLTKSEVSGYSSSSIYHERSMLYDSYKNPFYGICFFSPLDINGINSNRHNLLEVDVNWHGKSFRFEYEYSYKDEYPVSVVMTKYNSNGVLIKTDTTQFIYD